MNLAVEEKNKTVAACELGGDAAVIEAKADV